MVHTALVPWPGQRQLLSGMLPVTQRVRVYSATFPHSLCGRPGKLQPAVGPARRHHWVRAVAHCQRRSILISAAGASHDAAWHDLDWASSSGDGCTTGETGGSTSQDSSASNSSDSSRNTTDGHPTDGSSPSGAASSATSHSSGPLALLARMTKHLSALIEHYRGRAYAFVAISVVASGLALGALSAMGMRQRAYSNSQEAAEPISLSATLADADNTSRVNRRIEHLRQRVLDLKASAQCQLSISPGTFSMQVHISAPARLPLMM